jgi:pimeloyl-ACP methyl ester carboxylesterase
MQAIRESAPGSPGGRITLVMLPGARDRAQDLVDHGFVRALRRRGAPVDAIVVDAHADYYVDQSLVQRLEREIIGPLRAVRPARVWLMGISLGGMGALEYARRHAGSVAGVVLLAPFLGTRGLIAEVVRAGGLAHWAPGARETNDDERALMAWLKDGFPVDLPRIYLGYGTEDRYAPASRLLAARLPPQDVLGIAGGHDWATWLELWERLLDSGALQHGNP